MGTYYPRVNHIFVVPNLNLWVSLREEKGEEEEDERE